MRAGNAAGMEAARQAIEEAKRALGERGDPWWRDGAPDWNRHMAVNTPYAEWFFKLGAAAGSQAKRRPATHRKAGKAGDATGDITHNAKQQ